MGLAQEELLQELPTAASPQEQAEMFQLSKNWDGVLAVPQHSLSSERQELTSRL